MIDIYRYVATYAGRQIDKRMDREIDSQMNRQKAVAIDLRCQTASDGRAGGSLRP